MFYVRRPVTVRAAVARSRPTRQSVGPLVGQPYRTTAVRHALLQPRSRAFRSATRSRASSSSRARRCRRTITTSFQGTAQAFQISMQGPGWVLLLAIFVIYVVLGILYESFIHPITILSGLPVRRLRRAADAAALQAGPEHLRLRRRHHAGRPRQEERHHDDRLRDRGAPRAKGAPADAIYEACLVRFRPIMMTTMAALMGTLPIALGGARAPRRGVRSAWRSSAACSSRRRSRST